ncbi:hypothetical protein NQZ68_022232 [Dissostichus eleginoides]|nr:hypothetical protein NQZ68_022232 [Dissostichus eleginoides]
MEILSLISKEEGGDGLMVKLSKVNGLKKIEDEAERREMITPALREALTKQATNLTNLLKCQMCFQGYKLIGSHSGVKLCRWTKSMLRGRGGCYKHTFYGIESHRCMETTPSLACANKCVFCWREACGQEQLQSAVRKKRDRYIGKCTFKGAKEYEEENRERVLEPSIHNTNPVGTEWRWKMDPAEKILEDALEKHQTMIRQFRVPNAHLCPTFE